MKRHNHPNHARFLTFSTYRRLPLFGTETLRTTFVDQLLLTRERHPFLLHAWVLMPNHAHVLARFPADGDPESVLRTLKTGVAKRIIARWRELDASVLQRITDRHGRARFWQRGGGYDRNIYSMDEFHEKLAYIHANPVRSGLVDRDTDWAWGSARWWAGDRDGTVPCDNLGSV